MYWIGSSVIFSHGGNNAGDSGFLFWIDVVSVNEREYGRKKWNESEEKIA
jgi:hypothetical protein